MSTERIQRINREFDDVRQELFQELEKTAPEELDWVPRPGMKAIRAQLDEIGRMEKIMLEHIKTGDRPSWDDALTWPDDDVESYVNVLKDLRGELKDYMATLSDSDLDEPLALQPEWVKYWGVSELAREEYFRWLIRHEYYHLGQIISLLWTLGKNPYETA